MRILVVHNRYRTSAPSGENIYVEKEIAELQNIGYKVEKCYIENDNLVQSSIGKALVILEIIFPIYSFLIIFLNVYRFRPDRIHFHNTFPRISWLAVSVFAKKSALTLHNYRLFCVNGMALRDGKICTSCADKGNLSDGRIFRCYRNSLLSTLGVQLYIFMMRRFSRLKSLTAIYCFSSYQRELISKSLACNFDNLIVKNNFHPMRDFKQFTHIPPKPRVAFVGRFSEEKGLKDLLKCITVNRALFQEVHIVGGSSQDLSKLRVNKADLPKNVILHGRLGQKDVSEIMSLNHVLFVPSTCLEGQPSVVFEAIENGCLPIVSDVPTLLDFIQKLGLNTSLNFKDCLTFERRFKKLIHIHNSRLPQVNDDVARSLQNFCLSANLYKEV